MNPLKKVVFLFLVLGMCIGIKAGAADSKDFSLPNPIPPHPRLLASQADWERIKEQIKTDPVSIRIYASLEKRAKQLLDTPPVDQPSAKAGNILSEAREVLDRILNLALVARVTGDKAYADRAIKEMLSAAHYPTWNPKHFLDVGEFSFGIAVGYDWLYDQLSDTDRKQIAGALLEKGLKPSYGKNLWWVSGTNNWTQVCHSGISAAAIAIADLQPELATQILQRAIHSIPKVGKGYAPDGAYPEGPMYWGYGTLYHTILASALQTFTGQAYGLDTLPGFAESAAYIAQVTSPLGLNFNYSDSTEKHAFEVPLFWFARQFKHPEWLRETLLTLDSAMDYYDRKNNKSGDGGTDRCLALALIWRDPSITDKGENTLPLNWHARGTNPIAIYRSKVGDPKALYLGIKGGSPSRNHGHMDVGSFVLESDGVRWAIDLGVRNYTIFEKAKVGLWKSQQDSGRWGIFHIGPESHNILRFDSERQNVKGQADFVRFEGEGPQPDGVIDLTTIYAGQVQAARRGVMLLDKKAVLFQDEWTAGERPVNAAWQMLTRANVKVLPGKVQLEQGGATMTLSILEPANADVEIKEAKELQNQLDPDNPGVRRIAIKTHTEAGASGSFRILAIPGSSGGTGEVGEVKAPASRKLLDWPGALQKD